MERICSHSVVGHVSLPSCCPESQPVTAALAASRTSAASLLTAKPHNDYCRSFPEARTETGNARVLGALAASVCQAQPELVELERFVESGL
eukprot:1722208-Amphidinium_carterae.1